MLVDTTKWREIPVESDEDETYMHIACGNQGIRRDVPRPQAASGAGSHAMTTAMVELVCPHCEAIKSASHIAAQTSYHEFIRRNL